MELDRLKLGDEPTEAEIELEIEDEILLEGEVETELDTALALTRELLEAAGRLGAKVQPASAIGRGYVRIDYDRYSRFLNLANRVEAELMPGFDKHRNPPAADVEDRHIEARFDLEYRKERGTGATSEPKYPTPISRKTKEAVEEVQIELDAYKAQDRRMSELQLRTERRVRELEDAIREHKDCLGRPRKKGEKPYDATKCDRKLHALLGGR